MDRRIKHLKKTFLTKNNLFASIFLHPTKEQVVNHIYAALHDSSPNTLNNYSGVYLNIGYCGGRTPEERFKDKDYKSKNAGTGTWRDVLNYGADSRINRKVESSLHHALKHDANVIHTIAIANNNNQEQFFFKNMSTLQATDLIRIKLNNILNGIARSKNYAMRAEQKACVQKMLAAKKTGSDKFLVAAKMRFGKTFTVYQFLKALNSLNIVKKVLIVTFKVQVKDSWQHDYENHVDFVNLPKFYSNPENRKDNGDGTYFVSMQSLFASDRNDAKDFDWIYNVKWDVVVVDEEHYGTDTMLSSNLFDKINANFWIYLSGTAYNSILSNEFSKDQIFEWSYIDEQNAKKNWNLNDGSNPYAILPDLKMFSYDIIDQSLISRNNKFYSSSEQFSIAKAFETDSDGIFKNPQVILKLIETVNMSADDMPDDASPFYNPDICKNQYYSRNILARLPSVAACVAFEKMLLNNPIKKGGKTFKVFNIAGTDNNINVEDYRQQLKAYDYTLTLTVDRFCTGVTVPEWGMVWLLDDTKSVIDYFQTIFRCQTPWLDENGSILKDKCFVIDFNPHRMINAIVDSQSLINNGKSVESNITDWLKCAQVFSYDKGGLKEIKTDFLMETLLSLSRVNKEFSNGNFIDSSKINTTLQDSLKNVQAVAATSILVELQNTNIKKGKTSKATSVVNSKNESSAKELIEKIQKILTMLPKYAMIEALENITCDAIIAKNNNQLFLDVAGVSIKCFSEMINEKIINKEHIDNCFIRLNAVLNNVSPIL